MKSLILLATISLSLISTVSFADYRHGHDHFVRGHEYRPARVEYRHEHREWRDGRWWPIVEYRPYYYRPYAVPVVVINE